jgi:hypothetical protein
MDLDRRLNQEAKPVLGATEQTGMEASFPTQFTPT